MTTLNAGLLKKFLSPTQFLAVGFDELQPLFLELQKTIEDMPKTYEQDGKGDEAVAHLHYFIGDADFYIFEKDVCDEQNQAFGFVCMGHPELGYISIQEITQAGVEIDLHYKKQTLAEIKAQHGVATDEH